jgi:hypothetical protein
MAPKRTPSVSRKKGKEGGKSTLLPEEEEALRAFCADISVEEMPFEKWQNIGESIDITVPLFVTKEEANQGTTRQVHFIRQVHEVRDGKRCITKQKAFCVARIPPLASEGCTIVIEKQGDLDGDRQGDVKVIIQLKS